MDLNEIINELKDTGIYIINEYFSDDEISLLLNNFRQVLESNKDKCQHQNNENLNMDYRLFGIENVSEYVKTKITELSFFTEIADLYMAPQKQHIQGTLLTYLEPVPGINANSGGSWHRDTHAKVFKVLIYLNDVDGENGCFQFVTKSRMQDIGLPETRNGTSTRYTDETVQNLVNNRDCEIMSICGKPGTVIFADTSYIHRGKPIISGERCVYTNYYKGNPKSIVKNATIWKNAYLK